jgi:MinD superfamily P-loop ATPase
MITHKNSLNQLVILSGKGGTGKTSLAASLMYLSSKSQFQGVFVDADVDAANLALVSQAVPIESHIFMGSQCAEINTEKCNQCDRCFEICRFNAINRPDIGRDFYAVNDLLCEGCAACFHVCPQAAIQMNKQQDGEWFHSTSPYGHLYHAELFPGAENTGKLVTTVKQHAKLYAEDHDIPLVIIDGPPGIGCPVISASAGVDLALLVAEPSVSGIHDLERISAMLKHFNIAILVCINKADLYPEGTQAILQLAKDHGYPIAGKISFDDVVPQAIVKAQPVSQFAPNSRAAKEIELIWKQIKKVIFKKDGEL